MDRVDGTIREEHCAKILLRCVERHISNDETASMAWYRGGCFGMIGVFSFRNGRFGQGVQTFLESDGEQATLVDMRMKFSCRVLRLRGRREKNMSCTSC